VLCGLLDVNLGSGPPKSWLRSFWWLLLVVAAGLQLYTVQETLAKTADTMPCSGVMSSTSACSRNPTNWEPDTAFGGLTRCGASQIMMS